LRQVCLPQAVRGPRLGRDVIGLCAPCGWFTAADLDGTPLAQACVACACREIEWKI